MLAATATTNSAVFTDPTTLQRDSLPLESSDDVATGPQPPPPIASIHVAELDVRRAGGQRRADLGEVHRGQPDRKPGMRPAISTVGACLRRASSCT